MKILIACEESQVVCKAFREVGHEAYSCDVVPCSGGHPEWHIQDDVMNVLRHDVVSPFSCEWDMVIAFPPCTDLAVSGSRHFEQKRKDGRQQKSIWFFEFFTQLKNSKVAIENPVGIMSSIYRKPDQIIQPYEFGEDASKKTCLWLKGLPLLVPTDIIPGRMVDGKMRWANQTDSGQNKLGPSPGRAALRSKTYPGVAQAMASQWGSFLKNPPKKVKESQISLF